MFDLNLEKLICRFICQNVCDPLSFLHDNIFIRVGTK